MSISNSNPILVQVTRGGAVESVHRGAFVVTDTTGKVLHSAGDVSQLIFPRSSLKLLQVLPLIESGAVEELGLSEQEIALACASHNGEAMHVQAVASWLKRIGLDENALECGAAMPINEATKLSLVRAGGEASKTHNNCSGKHTGMLSLAKHQGLPVEGYSEYQHPVQQSWLTHLSNLSGVKMSEMVWDRDGCGMPAPQMPLDAFARCWAQFAAPEKQSDTTAIAMRQVLSAIAKYPQMIAGSERCCSEVIKQTQGKVIVKTGAEGVFGAVIPDLGLGLALKVDDGATRASEVALGYLLTKLDALTAEEQSNLAHFFAPSITNTQAKVTGHVKGVEA